MSRLAPPRAHVLLVALGYVAVTAVVSWPLVTQLTTSLAGDYGDSAFITWVIGWVAPHLLRLLQGDASAWAAMWQAPIFAPEPDTLAYSEHFIGPALQALPVLWLTHNPLLAHNLLHLSAFVLTALATHLLTWRVTGSHVGGAAAALTYSFSHYRLYWSLSHLQTLSVHWWILALLALDAFAATGSVLALTGVTAAMVLLSLSSTYLMAYSALFTPLVAVWVLARHGRLTDVRRWLGLAAAGLATLACVWPVVRRYLAMRDTLGVTRSLSEMTGNSVTLAGYVGELPWFGAILALAAIALVIRPRDGAGELSRPAKLGLLALALLALVLSLGPVVAVGARTIAGPYQLLFTYVPGFQGLRAPQRFAVIGLLFLSVLAGIGAAWLARWRTGVLAVALLTLVATRTAWTQPYLIDGLVTSADLPPPPPYLRPAATAPAIYRFAATLPRDAVLAELPFGDMAYEIRYTFFTLAHGRRILNGYSGVQPPSYVGRTLVLREPLADPDATWRALAPATHVVVHSGGWHDDTGDRLRAWLESRDARVVANAEGAWLYELPRR